MREPATKSQAPVRSFAARTLKTSLVVSAIAMGGCGGSPKTELVADASADSRLDSNPGTDAIPGDSSRFALGTNLNGLSYYSTELPFLDAFRASNAWVSGTKEVFKDGRQLDLDERGWVRSLEPGQLALTVLFGDVHKFRGTIPRRYVVEYQGSGTLEYGEQASLVQRGDHRDIIEIGQGPGNATISLTATDKMNYLRNIRATPEGSTPGDLFSLLFLDNLKGYRALRFMIWMLGESNDDIAARTWSNRPRMDDARWTIKGAPLEVMVALANKVHADPWFTIPHAADNDYVRQFATAIRDSLDPGLKVYLEYSNEVWNTVYPQTAYAREQGLAQGLGPDPMEAVLRFYGKRATEIFQIWTEVLPKERLVRLLSFQSDGMPEYSDETTLSFGETRKHVDAITIGPYFGTDNGSDAAGTARIRNMTLDQFMTDLETSALPKAKEQMSSHVAVARKYGVPLIAYEGGQHLWNMTGTVEPAVDDLFNRANRDPRMGALYTRYLRDWAEAGGGLFMHLLDCGNFENAGNWGAKEYLTQPREFAPKYDAIQKWIEGR